MKRIINYDGLEIEITYSLPIIRHVSVYIKDVFLGYYQDGKTKPDGKLSKILMDRIE